MPFKSLFLLLLILLTNKLASSSQQRFTEFALQASFLKQVITWTAVDNLRVNHSIQFWFSIGWKANAFFPSLLVGVTFIEAIVRRRSGVVGQPGWIFHNFKDQKPSIGEFYAVLENFLRLQNCEMFSRALLSKIGHRRSSVILLHGRSTAIQTHETNVEPVDKNGRKRRWHHSWCCLKLFVYASNVIWASIDATIPQFYEVFAG